MLALLLAAKGNLPIFTRRPWARACASVNPTLPMPGSVDRKSTRLNSSHEWTSYAVFCLKKKSKRQNVAAVAQRNEADLFAYQKLLDHQALAECLDRVLGLCAILRDDHPFAG